MIGINWYQIVKNLSHTQSEEAAEHIRSLLTEVSLYLKNYYQIIWLYYCLTIQET